MVIYTETMCRYCNIFRFVYFICNSVLSLPYLSSSLSGLIRNSCLLWIYTFGKRYLFCFLGEFWVYYDSMSVPIPLCLWMVWTKCYTVFAGWHVCLWFLFDQGCYRPLILVARLGPQSCLSRQILCLLSLTVLSVFWVTLLVCACSPCGLARLWSSWWAQGLSFPNHL